MVDRARALSGALISFNNVVLFYPGSRNYSSTHACCVIEGSPFRWETVCLGTRRRTRLLPSGVLPRGPALGLRRFGAVQRAF